jgi:hypothetical protein
MTATHAHPERTAYETARPAPPAVVTLALAAALPAAVYLATHPEAALVATLSAVVTASVVAR